MALAPAWQQGVARLVADREHGASHLAVEALALLEQAARETRELGALAELARALRAARPSMPAIPNLVNLAMHEALQSVEDPARAVAQAARRARERAVEARRARERAVEARGQAAREAAALARGTVLTHSASETVTKALRAAARAKQLARLVVAEGRPGFEGRHVARQLAEEGVEVLLVVDAALGLHAREADVALVGADAILSDGSLLNKVGTRLLALACERAGTPLHAAADRFKVAAQATLPLEEKGPAEVWPDAPAGVSVRNIYFDRTEPALLQAFATDAGLLAPEGIARLAEEHARWAGWEARLRRARGG